MMDSLNEVSLGSKFKFVGTSPFLPEQTGHVTGADGKWYDTDGNGYAPADVPSNKAMTYYASKDLLPKAFAVYSDDDQSLNFYKRSGVPAVGDTFEGKTATAVYTGIENVYNRPWGTYAPKIKTATVVDAGLQPCNMDRWFYGCQIMTVCNLDKLDTSSLTDASYMFFGCNSLTTLDLSNWDTSNVTSMNGMFYSCSNLTTIGDLSNWNTGKVTNMSYMFTYCSKLSADCSNWDVSKVNNHSNFNKNATRVTVPLAWQASSDEGGEGPTIAPLCEEQGNGDALNVSDETGNDEATSKMDGKASADSETEGSNTASATDEAGAKEEEASGDIVQEEPTAA